MGNGSVASSDGCRIAYWEAGPTDAPAIVFVHGFALDHSVWHRQFADPALVHHHRLVALDLRGHGRSGRPVIAEGYLDGRRWADDLEALRVGLDLQRPVVVAWSFGGRMVNDYLRYYGTAHLAGIQYIAAATLAEPAAVGPEHACLAGLCSPDPQVEAETARHFVATVLRLPPGSPEHRSALQVLAATTPSERSMMRQRPLNYDLLLAQLTLPVLLTHGLEDAVVLPVLAERLAAHLPQAHVSLYEKTGHAPFLEHPARFNLELASFMRICHCAIRPRK